MLTVPRSEMGHRWACFMPSHCCSLWAVVLLGEGRVKGARGKELKNQRVDCCLLGDAMGTSPDWKAFSR